MRKARGLTLVELMIAVLITGVVAVAALLAIQAQQRTFYAGQKGRAAQGSGRAALLFLEQKVALAGYGMDPANAFDFAWYGCGAGCVRDRTDGPDELVFYARNPNFRVDAATSTLHGRVWSTNSISSTQIQLEVRGGEVFPRGQIVQLGCTDELRIAYVTVSRTTVAGAPGPLDIPIDPVAPGLLTPGRSADPFRRQDLADPNKADVKKWNGCLATGNPRAFLIDRYRFYVRVEDMGGGRSDPFLVLDTGTDTDGDGDLDLDDEILVAEGIENLQVGYGFLDPALPVAGTEPGTPIDVRPPGSAADATPHAITPTNFPGNYDGSAIYAPLHSSQFFVRSTTPLEPQRTTNDQGNIRYVELALVARSPEPDPTGSANLRYAPGSPLWILNFNDPPDWITDYAAAQGGDDRFQRAVLRTTVAVPNLAARGFVPN